MFVQRFIKHCWLKTGFEFIQPCLRSLCSSGRKAPESADRRSSWSSSETPQSLWNKCFGPVEKTEDDRWRYSLKCFCFTSLFALWQTFYFPVIHREKYRTSTCIWCLESPVTLHFTHILRQQEMNSLSSLVSLRLCFFLEPNSKHEIPKNWRYKFIPWQWN